MPSKKPKLVKSIRKASRPGSKGGKKSSNSRISPASRNGSRGVEKKPSIKVGSVNGTVKFPKLKVSKAEGKLSSAEFDHFRGLLIEKRREILGDVGLSNGLDWSDDRESFYYADSASGGVDVFVTDPETGTLGRRRRFVTVGGVPDGLTLDAEGCVWVAIWGGGELRRYTPGGALDTVVSLPVRQVTSAAFGGADLGTLYITTARENLTPADLREQPHAGDIFACTPGVRGRPPFRFAH